MKLAPRRRAMAAMAAFAIAFAIAEGLGEMFQASYSIYQVVFTRYAVHLALMGLLWGVRDPRSLVRTGRPAYQLARSLLMLGMPAAYVFTLKHHVDPPSMMAVFWLIPVFILAFATVAGERPGPGLWAASILTYAGALLFAGTRSFPPLVAMVGPLGMATTFSAYVVMTRSLRTEARRANLFYTAFGVAAVLAPFMPARWVAPSPHDFALMAAIGLLGFLSLSCIDYATEKAPAAAAAPFVALQLPFGLALAAAAGEGPLGRRAVAGAALIAGACAYTWLRGAAGEDAALRPS